MARSKRKDISIELMRFLACFFVICIHLGSNYFSNNELSKNAVFLSCLFADAVAMFWFITGAFLFKKDDYKRNLKNLLTRVVAPMFGLILFIFLFNDWIFNGAGIIESISQSIHSIPIAIKSIFLDLATPVAHTGQLWYLFVYIFVIIFFPVTKAFVDKLDNPKKEKIFLIISFFILFLNDISDNHFAGFNHTAFGALIPAIIFVIYGHIFYKNKEKILPRIHTWQCVAGILILALIRSFALIFIYQYGDGNLDRSIIYWFSAFSAFDVVLIFILLQKITQRIKNITVAKIAGFIGSFTFLIYLLHEIVIDFLNKYGVFPSIHDFILTDKSLWRLLAFYVISAGLVFVVSLAISIMLRFILKKQLSLVKLLKNKFSYLLPK